MKIIVADDSLTIRRILSGLLVELGYEEKDLILVDCGEDALAALKNNSGVGLILLDWNMPLMNGLDCLKSIKASPEFKEIPVIMVTAEAQISSIREAMQLGASNYLLKPFTGDKLRAVIAGCLCNKK